MDRNGKRLIVRNIAEDFSVCQGETCAKRLAKTLFLVLIAKDVCEETLAGVEEWKVLFHLSESEAGQSNEIRKRREALTEIFGVEIVEPAMEYKALYALQTTYSIIVKLIAVKTLSGLTGERDDKIFENASAYGAADLRALLCDMEEGSLAALSQVKNLIEGDFYTWYCAERQWNSDISKAILDVVDQLNQYAPISASTKEGAIDIFRELYMEVMPNAVRHSLGEYYTPAWLADNVVENALKRTPDDWTAVDPSCGSGVFLISLLRRLIPGQEELEIMSQEEKTERLYEILRRVQGVDINPISVLTARVNYVICILPLLHAMEDSVPIRIPIYLGDSASPVNRVSLGGVNCNTGTIMAQGGEILEVCLPNRFVASPDFFDHMNRIWRNAKGGDAQMLFQQLQDSMQPEDLNEEVSEKLTELCTYVMDSKAAVNRLRIITNYLAVSNLSGASLLIGNPPWVKWEHLPQKYAEKIKKQCVEKHLFSGQRYMGAIQLNLCALIANMTASHWLSEQGNLVFIMPKTMLTQDSYSGFRNFYLDFEKKERMYLYRIDDWSESGDPFSYTAEKFATFYYSREFVDYKKGVPVCFMKKVRGIPIDVINEQEYDSGASVFFEKTEGIAVQLDKERTGFTLLNEVHAEDPVLDVVGRCDYKARTGAEFTPSEIYWLKWKEAAASGNCAVFENLKLRKAVHKATENLPVSIETKYVYPLAQGPCIGKYSFRQKEEYCIFPYYLEEGKCHLAEAEELRRESPALLQYLTRNDAVIEGQSQRSKEIKRGKASYALSKVGPYSFSPVMVAFRDNTCMAAVVLTPKKTAWGENKQYICAKHAPFISVDKEDRHITEDEAYYLAAILNTKVVERYFQCTYSIRSYSIKNLNIYMPKYDTTKREHVMLAELSKIAHQTTGEEQRDVMEKIEDIYREMCYNGRKRIGF